MGRHISDKERVKMTSYIFIESRDPFESRDTQMVEETAATLAERGHEVTVFLVQNGVLASRKNARNSCVARLAEAGVTVMADDFSLRERGIRHEEMRTDISPSSIETLVDILVRENTKALWQ